MAKRKGGRGGSNNVHVTIKPKPSIVGEIARASGGLAVAGAAGAGCEIVENLYGSDKGRLVKGLVVGAGVLARFAINPRQNPVLHAVLTDAGKGVVGAVGAKMGAELARQAQAERNRQSAEAARAAASDVVNERVQNLELDDSPRVAP